MPDPQNNKWYGTIDQSYVRQRDAAATRKRGFVLRIETIERLEAFCTSPKQSTNEFVERLILEFLDQHEKEGSARGTGSALAPLEKLQRTVERLDKRLSAVEASQGGRKAR